VDAEVLIRVGYRITLSFSEATPDLPDDVLV
jgi:hypothetical protein